MEVIGFLGCCQGDSAKVLCLGDWGNCLEGIGHMLNICGGYLEDVGDSGGLPVGPTPGLYSTVFCPLL